MRTGGDDIAQGFALMGVRPVWDTGSTRVCGFQIIALEELGRPRVDVTLRVSGFFRDAFPAQIALFDHAARAVMASDEPEAQNPAAASLRSERIALEAVGLSAADASQQAGFRVFGSKPGAYGAGLQALIDARTADDEQIWAQAKDLGEAYVEWSGYAYGAGQNEEGWGQTAHKALRSRLRRAQAVVQNQDNREHDLLDSDDYYQFEGGAAAAVEALSGAKPQVYHNDHSRPERPIVRTLSEEISRVVRSRVVNPKWIAGVRRHGYKGAFEIAATIDYLFAFAATTGAVQDHHFDLVYDAFIGDNETRRFLEEENPAALSEIESRLQEAVDRELWRPRRNFVAQKMARL
jgi:cobaltochelatase CobN